MIAADKNYRHDADFEQRQLGRPSRKLMWLFALAVLLPSLYGFGSKFLEFVALAQGDAQGAFAITPILNYLLASCGFLLLFGWAAIHGMFKDVEEPKYAMLENEAWLDRLADDQGRLPGRMPPGAIDAPSARSAANRLRVFGDRSDSYE